MRIAIGSDHAGFELKGQVVAWLREQGHDVDDVGTHSTASTDYPVWGQKVARAVVGGAAERGILVCGTGQGMAIAANKVLGCRAAVVSDAFSAKAAMEHNDARVLCIGARVVGSGLALLLVETWLNARFAGGRHAQRVALLEGDDDATELSEKRQGA